MGEVYRARDPRLNRDVAIKVLPASYSEDPDRLRRFEHEAKAAGVLNHPNITGGLRLRAGGRRALRRPGAARGRDAARGARRRQPLAAPRRRLRDRDRARARRRAREGHRAPGPEAGEPLRHERRADQDPRLRPGEADGAGGRRQPDERSRRRLPPPNPERFSGRSVTCRPSRCAARPPITGPTSSPSAPSSTKCSPGKRAFHARLGCGHDVGDPQGRPAGALGVTNPNVSPTLERIIRALPREDSGAAPPLGARSRFRARGSLADLGRRRRRSGFAHSRKSPGRPPRRRRSRGDRGHVRARPARAARRGLPRRQPRIPAT